MGLLPDLELQVVDVLEVVLAEALAPAAAPPLRRRRRRGLVAGRRRRGLRDVHRHRRHRRLGGWGSSCVRGKVSARIAEAVGLLVGLGLAVSPRSALGFIEAPLRGGKVGHASSDSKSELGTRHPDSARKLFLL